MWDGHISHVVMPQERKELRSGFGKKGGAERGGGLHFAHSVRNGVFLFCSGTRKRKILGYGGHGPLGMRALGEGATETQAPLFANSEWRTQRKAKLRNRTTLAEAYATCWLETWIYRGGRLGHPIRVMERVGIYSREIGDGKESSGGDFQG